MGHPAAADDSVAVAEWLGTSTEVTRAPTEANPLRQAIILSWWRSKTHKNRAVPLSESRGGKTLLCGAVQQGKAQRRRSRI